jgi:hypothetical protein
MPAMSRRVRDVIAVAVALAAVPALHYLLDETWPNSLVIPMFGVVAGVTGRLALRRAKQRPSA